MFKQIWFPEMVQHHIMSRHGKEDLNSRYYATTYPDVYAAAERTFGSWGEAIESCGLDYSLIKKYKSWTKQSVLDEIRRLAKEGDRCSRSTHRITTSRCIWRQSNASATGVKRSSLPGWIIRVSGCAGA